MRARYYSPAQQRFTSIDPFKGRMFEPVTLNDYIYAGGNPVMYTDPSGEMFGLSMNMATMGILAVGGATTIWGITNRRGTSGIQSVWLTVAMYNAKSWIIEEYMAMVMYASGGQSTQSPWKHLEEEFLNMGPGDPCKKIKEYIKKMKEQIEWRENEPNFKPSSSRYNGHVERIRRLNKQIELLTGYLALGLCQREK